MPQRLKVLSRCFMARVAQTGLLERKKQVRRERSKPDAGVTDRGALSDRGRQSPQQFAGHQDQVFLPGPFRLPGRRASQFEGSLLEVNERERGMMLDRKELVRHGYEHPFGHPAKLADEE